MKTKMKKAVWISSFPLLITMFITYTHCGKVRYRPPKPKNKSTDSNKTTPLHSKIPEKTKGNIRTNFKPNSKINNEKEDVPKNTFCNIENYEKEKKWALEMAKKDPSGKTIPIAYTYAYSRNHHALPKNLQGYQLSILNPKVKESFINLLDSSSNEFSGHYSVNHDQARRDYRLGNKCYFNIVKVKQYYKGNFPGLPKIDKNNSNSPEENMHLYRGENRSQFIKTTPLKSFLEMPIEKMATSKKYPILPLIVADIGPTILSNLSSYSLNLEEVLISKERNRYLVTDWFKIYNLNLVHQDARKIYSRLKNYYIGAGQILSNLLFGYRQSQTKSVKHLLVLDLPEIDTSSPLLDGPTKGTMVDFGDIRIKGDSYQECMGQVIEEEGADNPESIPRTEECTTKHQYHLTPSFGPAYTQWFHTFDSGGLVTNNFYYGDVEKGALYLKAQYAPEKSFAERLFHGGAAHENPKRLSLFQFFKDSLNTTGVCSNYADTDFFSPEKHFILKGDPNYQKIGIWVDTNRNGLMDENEKKSLSDYKIVALNPCFRIDFSVKEFHKASANYYFTYSHFNFSTSFENLKKEEIISKLFKTTPPQKRITVILHYNEFKKNQYYFKKLNSIYSDPFFPAGMYYKLEIPYFPYWTFTRADTLIELERRKEFWDNIVEAPIPLLIYE